MNPSIGWIVESALAAVLFLVAAALSAPFRGRARAEPYATRDWPWRLAGHISLPVLVLALTEGARVLMGIAAPGARDAAESSGRLNAWCLFWVAILGFSALEGFARLVCARRARPFPVPDLIFSIVRFLVFAGAALWVLRFQLRLNISPLLASTALLTAVVGFALQGVLGNLLSGMSLHITRSVVPHDWIGVEGVEGEVMETNWRETRLRTVGGHYVIIPNGTLASAQVRHMTRPTRLRRHSIAVGASYSDAPGEVIEALQAAARDAPDVLAEPAPSAYVTEFKDFGINYELRYWTTRYYDRSSVDGAVGRRIWYEFKRRGIEIPFPMSDKLLNDFMEVVYHQRRMPPHEDDVRRGAADLMRSELIGSMLAGADGRPLLREEELQDLARAAKRLRYTDGETVFRQGDGGQSCYIVARGRVSGRVASEGSEAVRFELGPGSLVGEMSLMAGLPRAATVRAAGEVELLELDEKAFARLLALRPEIPERLARIVADRAAANSEAIERLKNSHGADAVAALGHAGLLSRFMRLLGIGPTGQAEQ